MSDYIGKIVKINLDKFYYKGKVIFEDENFLVLIDITSKEVRINKMSIVSLEVLK